MQIVKGNRLTIDLYHGTSTLFLDSIIKNGLGGVNPVNEWNILGLCKEVCELADVHLKETKLYQVSYQSLKQMSNQVASENFNFQHGDTYVSPSQKTAISYAINKRYGSEILTYTIDFLKELIRKEIPYVTKDLFRKHTNIFGLIESNPSPLLIQIKNVELSSLKSEGGQDPLNNLNEVDEAYTDFGENYEIAVQQLNFRLISPALKDSLELYLINVQRWSHFDPKYNLYKLGTS